jgi:hypothetical protein
MSELRNRAFLDAYGIAMSTSTTVVDAVVEAAAPAIEEVLTGRAGRLVRGFAQEAALYFREKGFVPTTTLMRTGLGVLLLIKVRNYPMAAYLVVPVYLLWETIGFSIVEGLWRRFSPQIMEQAENYYDVGIVWLDYQWRRMRRAQRAVRWLKSNWQLAGGTAVVTVLLSWIVRRFYRWRNSPKTRFRAYSRKFFRAAAARQLSERRHRGETTKALWLPHSWRLAWARIRIERLVPRVVDEFGCSKAFIRRLLLDAVPCDSNPQLRDWLQQRSADDGEALQIWIERGLGGNPPAKVREQDFLAIAEKLRVYQSIYRQESLCTPFQLSFTLPSETLFGDDSASHADKCGEFHMRVRYGFQNETGENALAETINWRLDAEPLEESAKGRWRENVSSSTSKRLQVRRIVSKWQKFSKAGRRGVRGSSPSATAERVSQIDTASAAVDEEGWFNPLVYDGGARLSPRLKNLHGEELARMPPLRVQERKWENRFVSDGTAGSESAGAAMSSTEQQQQHELRRFMLTGFMPTCRPAGMILPAGVREMCGQAYVELEVAPAIDADGTLIPWSEAAWPEPAKHRTRLEPWHRKWGDRWASPRDAVGRGLGPGGGESALALYYEVPDTNDISELLMHKMVKAGFSTMLRTAPELQYKISRELSSRLDVNIPLVQNFIRVLGKRTLQGRILPWLAMQQGLAGYIISRSGSPEERESMLRAALRWMIRQITHQSQHVDYSHGHDEPRDDRGAAQDQQNRRNRSFQHNTPESLGAPSTPISAVESPTSDTETTFIDSATIGRQERAAPLGLERSRAESSQRSTEMFVLGDRRTVCLKRMRPEFLGIRIFYRGQRPLHTQESQNGDMWTSMSPQTVKSAASSAPVAPHTAPPAGSRRAASLHTPRSVPLKGSQPSTGLRSRLWWAANATVEQQEDDGESETEEYDEWNEVYYLGNGGEDEAEAFVESLREAGEFTQPRNVLTHFVKWPRTAVICDVPPETEFTVEVYLHPASAAVRHTGPAGTSSGMRSDVDLAEHAYPTAAGMRSLKMRWSLLSAAYKSELEDLVLGNFDLSVLPRSALNLDWDEPSVQDAASTLGLAPNGDDWRLTFGSDNTVEANSGVASPNVGSMPYTPRDQGDSCKVGVEGSAWSALSHEEKEAAKLLGWREQADDRSWVEGAIRLLGTEHRRDEGPLHSPHTPAHASRTAPTSHKSDDVVVTNKLCFGKRRASNSPDRADLIAAGAAGTTVQLRLDVSEDAAHEPNWLLIHINVGEGDRLSTRSEEAQIAESPHVKGQGSAWTPMPDPPALGDMLAVIPAATPKRVEEELRAWVMRSYRDLAERGQATRDVRWGGRTASDLARAQATAEAQAAERARLTALLDSGASVEDFAGVGLGELTLAGATKLIEDERAAAARWAQRSIVIALSRLYRARMTASLDVPEGNSGEPATAATAESTAAEAARVTELLLGPPGVSEDPLLQHELGTVASIALSGIAAKEIAPYISAARRVAVLLGVVALVIPAMFALLVAMATKALVVKEMEEWDSMRMT